MPKDNLAADDGGLGKLTSRLRDLETANPLENGSVDNGTLTVRSSSNGLVIEATGRFWAQEGAQIIIDGLLRAGALDVGGQVKADRLDVTGQAIIGGNAYLKAQTSLEGKVYAQNLEKLTSASGRLMLTWDEATGAIRPAPMPTGSTPPGGSGPTYGDGTTFGWPFDRAQAGDTWMMRDGSPGSHYGIDWPKGSGTPIPIMGAGTVVANYWDGDIFGWYVEVDHGTKGGAALKTGYAHMVSQSPLSVGTVVKRGDIVGGVGTTGYSTGPHLHLNTFRNGERIDPDAWMATYRNAT